MILLVSQLILLNICSVWTSTMRCTFCPEYIKMFCFWESLHFSTAASRWFQYFISTPKSMFVQHSALYNDLNSQLPITRKKKETSGILEQIWFIFWLLTQWDVSLNAMLFLKMSGAWPCVQICVSATAASCFMNTMVDFHVKPMKKLSEVVQGGALSASLCR